MQGTGYRHGRALPAFFSTLLGARVTEWTPPDAGHALDLVYGLFSADGGRGYARALAGNRRDRRIAKILQAASLPAPALSALRALMRLSGRRRLAEIAANYGHRDTAHYWDLVEAQIAYQRRFRAALDAAPGAPFDLIVAPACALPAFRHGASEELALAGAYTCLYNLLGYPTGVVPVTRVQAGEESERPESRDPMDRVARETERGSAGLPVGVQIIARPWREHVALAAMAAVEAVCRDRDGLPAIAPM